MPGRSTLEAIYLIHCLMEKNREHRKYFHMLFIDLEKAYNNVACVIIWRCLEVQGVLFLYIRIIQEMYLEVETCVRTPLGDTQYFSVEVGFYLGLVLNPLLFIVVLDMSTRDIQTHVSWCILYTDDIVLITEFRDKVNINLKRWGASLEDKGLRLSRYNTEYL